MFGPFKPTTPLSSGLLWKIPWRLSPPQKRRQRKRLRMVDNVVAVVDAALKRNAPAITSSSTATPAKKKLGTGTEGGTGRMGIDTTKNLERWKAEMPTEAEMRPKDKYTFFDRKERGYRKGVHKLPKWTRVSQRINPPGF